MEKETKSPETASEGQVSLDDLNRAADAAIEEVSGNGVKAEVKTEETVPAVVTETEVKAEEAKDEVKVEEEKPVESKKEEIKPDDNAERSRLGRRVKYLEENVLPDISKKLDTLALLLSGKKTESNEDEEYVAPQTQAEFEKQLKRIDERKQAQVESNRTRYTSGYLSATSRLGLMDENSDLHDEIMKEIQKPEFNVCYSNDYSSDPQSDAERNYFRAKTSLLSQKLKSMSVTKEPVNPFKGEKPKVSLGISGTSKTEVSKKPKIELDDAARDFIKRTNMSEKDVEEALSGEEKSYQRR